MEEIDIEKPDQVEMKNIKRQKLIGREQEHNVDQKALNKWTACVFGECG